MTAVKKDNVVQLSPTRMKSAEYERVVYVVTVPVGTNKDDMENPAFWSHVAMKLKPWDRLEVRCDDGAFFAEYLILACDRLWAKVKELSFVELNAKETELTDVSEYKIQWKGPHLKFCVIRTKDGGMLKERMEKDEASLWLKEYLNTVIGKQKRV